MSSLRRIDAPVDDQEQAQTALGVVSRAAVIREAGSRARVNALRVRRALDRMGIDSVDLLHFEEPGIPDALALVGGLSAVGELDLIVALTPQVEVDAARVAVQADASLARFRHAHPNATLRRGLRIGQVHAYTTLSVEVGDDEHLVVDHLIMQASGGTVEVRIDGAPLSEGAVVQVVAANPLAGLPRSSTTLDPSAIGSVTVLSSDGGQSQGYGLVAGQELWCVSQDPAELRIDGRLLQSEEREVRVHLGPGELKLVVVNEADSSKPRIGGALHRRSIRRPHG